jgi:hypothetical protein
MAGPWERYQTPTAPAESGPWTRYSRPAGPLPANAGLAELAARVGGLPVDTVENVVNLGLAGVGAALTAAGRPDMAPDLIKGSFGGSESIRRGLRATGEPGLSPDNPGPTSGPATAQYEFVARGGVLPGGALPAATSLVAEKIGGPEWAGVGALAPTAAISGYNAVRAPSLARQQQQNVIRDATLKEAQDAGYAVVPSQVNPSFVGNRLESVAGKAAMNQDAVLKNQQVTNTLARKAVGLPENVPLTPHALELRRTELSAPYREVSGLSPIAKQALEKLREARAEAKSYWLHYDRTATPESQKTAKKWDQRADIAERVIEQQAARAGKPELANELRQARREIAKTYDVERALSVGDGNVDARILARAIDRGVPLTGELATIAKFSDAFPQLTRSAAGNPTPGVSAIEPLAVGGFGLGGQGSGLGWWPAGLPFLRGPVRSTLLSDLYQRNFARPNYSATMVAENALQSFGRVGVIENEQMREMIDKEISQQLLKRTNNK